jgi:hypothetical protein
LGQTPSVVGIAQLKPPLLAQVPASVSWQAPPDHGQHSWPPGHPDGHMLLHPLVPPWHEVDVQACARSSAPPSRLLDA